jgi:hypothetical protein
MAAAQKVLTAPLPLYCRKTRALGLLPLGIWRSRYKLLVRPEHMVAIGKARVECFAKRI